MANQKRETENTAIKTKDICYYTVIITEIHGNTWDPLEKEVCLTATVKRAIMSNWQENKVNFHSMETTSDNSEEWKFKRC